MPAHIFPQILIFLGEVAIGCAIHDSVIADGPIAIQAQFGDVHDQGIAGRGRLDVERSGLGIAAQHAGHAFIVRAAGIDGGGVNGVARQNGEHRLVLRRESPMENRRNEVMPARAAAKRRIGRALCGCMKSWSG